MSLAPAAAASPPAPAPAATPTAGGVKNFKGGLTAPPRPEPPVVEDESSEDEEAEEEAEEEEEWGRSSDRGDAADAARRRTYILKSPLYGVTLYSKYTRALTFQNLYRRRVAPAH